MIDPDEIYARFARLFANAAPVTTAALSSFRAGDEPESASERSALVVGAFEDVEALLGVLASAGYAADSEASAGEDLAARIEDGGFAVVACDADCGEVAAAALRAARVAGAALVCRFEAGMASALGDAPERAASLDLLLGAADLAIVLTADDKAFARFLGCDADIVVLESAPDDGAASVGEALDAAAASASERRRGAWPHAAPAGFAAGARPIGAV
ncbi:hypothetical protein [Chenggangzhangella methanolivorans]|uniref:Uncharacterized protein n=1 Tax=Chenggangzhangella methanolivorans TaxID=1437009 RepID=A0A9E6UL30_9HYPH|nr:hypothetical protein [Chenggangzhangella methanolivorans]QZN98515.1 hypothetical protein K6K41_15825 [Chenggangzhangella methanolivorans]